MDKIGLDNSLNFVLRLNQKEKMGLKPLLWIILSLGLMWSKSSYGKVTGGTFVSGLGQTLSKVVDKNPYPFFKQFLTDVAIPNSVLFGNLTMWGEVLVAISLTLGAILLLFNPGVNKLVYLAVIGGLAGGLLLNIVFWFGFGWTSPSTDSVNLLMAAIEIVGIIFLVKQYSA